jgi:HEAT repeat protein
MHTATEEGFKAAAETLDLLATAENPDQILRAIEADGLNAFKAKVRNLLTNPDPIVRGFGALWLFVITGSECKQDIAKLLDERPDGPPLSERNLLHTMDRCMAAQVLGQMGAKEYAPRLLALVRSSDPHDRAAAVSGLGAMRLKEHVQEIAKRLSDDDSAVQTSAVVALAELDATEYGDEIARLLIPLGDAREAAIYALVKLNGPNGKKWVKDIAALLNDRFDRRDAAKALALLSAREYTPQIAQLIDDPDLLARNDALIALGILDAKEYQKQIAAHLQDEPFVRTHAAVALLLMSSQSNSDEIRDVIHAEWKLPELASSADDPAGYFSARIVLNPILKERRRQLTERAVETWKRIDRSQ